MINKDKPLVSIIVPIYGVEKYIEQCARSIFSQTYSNLEIIFVNDCTKDRSITVLENTITQYPHIKEKIRIVNLEQNQGLAGARLVGLNNAIGEYIIQFDSDDFVESTIVEKLVAIATKECSDIVICDMDHIYPNKSVRINVNPPLEKIELIRALFTGEVHASLCNKLIRRELYTKYGISPTVGLNMCEDLSVMYKLIYYSNKISYLPETLYHYRQFVEGSFSSNKMPLKHQLNRIELLQQVDRFIKESTKNNEKLRKYFKYLVTRNKGEMLLYGDLNNMAYFNNRETILSFKDIMLHPNLHANFKIVLLLEKLHLYPLLKLVRKLREVKQKFKSKIM